MRRVTLPFVDRIWRTRGSIVLEEQLEPREALSRLAPMFDREEVELDSDDTTVTFRKANPEAQHKLATFSSGTLHLANRDGRTELDYDAKSPALLLVFFAPLLFVALGQANVGLGMLEKEMSAGSRDKQEEQEDEEGPGELHWIDQMLGAPAPEKPDEAEKEERKKEEEEEKNSPENAYGLAAIFAFLYLVGRWLEPRLLKKTLRNALSGDDGPAKSNAG